MPKLKRIIIQCTKEHNITKIENILYLSYGFLKVAKDDANLVSLSSSFHNLLHDTINDEDIVII